MNLVTARLLWTSSRLHKDGGRDGTEQLIRVALVYAGRRLGRDTVLVHGAAAGGDTIAAAWWTGWGLPVEPWPADWPRASWTPQLPHW